MAENDKITLEVQVKNLLESAKQDVSALKNSGAIDAYSKKSDRNKNIAADIDAIFKRLEAYAGLSKITEKQEASVLKLFKDLDEILRKIDSDTRPISKSLKEYKDNLDKAVDGLKKAKEEVSKQSKGLSKDKTGYSYNKVANELANAGIKTIGGQALDAESIDKLGRALYSRRANSQKISDYLNTNYQAPNEKQKITDIYDTIIQAGKAQAEKYKAAVNNQTTAEQKLKEIQTNQVNVAGNNQIYLNALDRDLKISQATTLKDKDESSGESLGEIGTNKSKTQSSLGKAFKQFSIYNLILKNIKMAIREAVKTIKELDSSLTEQAMVTGKTREQTYELLSAYQNLATQTGATTKEVANLATQFMRQGKTTEDALVLTQAAMSAAKVAGISATDSVNYLTTALNGFQLSAEDAITVSDKFAAVAASAATSYDEIATALSKVASQANLAGMSIDYTTALLTKGLETTREAPETIGTALKTVIARMRELSDYGETLGGDTDINNVESQLAYVGIALRDNNGELRSTQDVLDELGKKWDTLNSNQQAAVAKALAGTRQQSRLIAMMSDYERVIELQQISERSAGATLAQMETYLEGMDAALNKINVAWEKIVTNIVDNEFIIDIATMIGGALDSISALVSNTAFLETLLITVSTVLVTTLATKTQTLLAQKLITKEEEKALKIQLEARLASAKALIIQKQSEIKEKQKTLQKQKQLELDTIDAKLQEHTIDAAEAARQKKEVQAKYAIEEEKTNAEIAQLNVDIANLRAQAISDQAQLNAMEVTSKTNWTNILSMVTTVGGGITSAVTGTQKWLMYLSLAGLAIRALPPLLKMVKIAQQAVNAEGLKGAFISLAQKSPEFITGISLLVLAGITAIAGFAGAFTANQKSTEEQVNSLSNEIYKLETKARSLDNIADSYDKIDKQIIKSKKDQEELNELIDQAADKMTDEEKAILNSKRTNKEKIDYIRIIQAKADEEAKKNRDQQLALINSLKGSQLQAFLDPNSSNSEVLTAQAAIYANNNSYLYDYIDGLGDVKDGVEEVAQALLEEFTPAEALAFANQPEQIKELVNQLNSLNKAYTSLSDKDKTGTVTEVLTSDDYSIVDKIDAYRQAIAALTPEMQELFNATYADIATFATFSESVLNFIDIKGITVNGINDIGDAINELGYTGEAATQKLQALFAVIADGTSIQDAITTVFGLDLSSKTGITQYNAVLKAYTDAIGTGILNMGQNIQSLKTNINSFYETAMKWSELTDSEKTAFLTDNMALFEGPEGQKLLKAIESQDYNLIYEALSDKDGTLYKKVQQQIQDIDEEIQLEYAKLEEDRNYAYIQYLEDQKKVLQDSTNLYAASLETRLEQEEKFLEEYKSYREKERDALKESLEKRKEAYSDYFEEINQEAEDEDFEEQENTLITNISKLAASTSANAINQQAELQKQLENLEKERIAELRQRAQDAIVENISDTIDDIDKKFDELLNSQQALLQAMNGDLNNPNELLSKLIGTKLMTEGLTNLQLSSYVQELQATYGSLNQFAGVDWSALGQVLNTLNLNVNGTTINNLTAEQQQSIYEAIQAALRQIGLN